MNNPIDSKNKILVSKVLTALLEDFKTTDWKVEFRYFITVAVIPSLVIITGLYILRYESPTLGVIPGWWGWLLYTSCGTTHESRKKNIKDIFWCIDPYIFDNFPSISRQNLLMKHSLNIMEFIVLSMIQRLHLIFGMLFFATFSQVYFILLYPLRNHDDLIFMYILGIIVVLAFLTGGVHEDLKLHYINVEPASKKYLWKYTAYVFLICLVFSSALYLSVFYLMRLILLH